MRMTPFERVMAWVCAATIIAAVLLVILSWAAHAQGIASDATPVIAAAVTPPPPVSTGSVDLTPLIQVLLSFLAVVLPALAGYIAWVLKQKMDIQANSAAAQAVDAATSDGAGLAYKLLAQMARNAPHSVEIQNAAVAAGVQHVMDAAGDSAKVREETGASLGQTVAAKLGTLMAHDPTITIGPVAPAPPVPAAPPKPADPAAKPPGDPGQPAS